MNKTCGREIMRKELKKWCGRLSRPKTVSSVLIIATFILGAIGGVSANDSTVKDDEFFVDPVTFGAKGDGVADDSASLQRAFTHCSKRGLVCRIASGKKYLVTSPLFLWGNAQLQGDDGTGTILFSVADQPYLLNIGISGRNRLEQPFSGIINNIKFTIARGKGGRIIYLWRTDGAQITNNVFDVGEYSYSATSSGNDNSWVVNGFKNCIRKNITISNNKINAASDNNGNEGIGLGHFDGATIEGNNIIGVGDDPIGIHFSKNITITNNKMKSVDGRLFVVNSQNVVIDNNYHMRIRSPKDGLFYKGISLLYIGFETLRKNKYSAPTNIKIRNNKLHYPPGSIDHGAAIYVYGPRNVNIKENAIYNNAQKLSASAIHLLPQKFVGLWSDPGDIDTDNVARPRQIKIHGNKFLGMYPLKIKMTGNCSEYGRGIYFHNNTPNDFVSYCDQVKSESVSD